MTDKNIKTKYMGFSKLKNKPVRRIDIRLFHILHITRIIIFYWIW